MTNWPNHSKRLATWCASISSTMWLYVTANTILMQRWEDYNGLQCRWSWASPAIYREGVSKWTHPRHGIIGKAALLLSIQSFPSESIYMVLSDTELQHWHVLWLNHAEDLVSKTITNMLLSHETWTMKKAIWQMEICQTTLTQLHAMSRRNNKTQNTLA